MWGRVHFRLQNPIYVIPASGCGRDKYAVTPFMKKLSSRGGSLTRYRQQQFYCMRKETLSLLEKIIK